MSPHWMRRRVRHLLIIARYDSTAFTELLSGVALILFRALILVLLPREYWPQGVADPLSALGLTEVRWGGLLLVLGTSLILFAGSSHYVLRMATTFVIILVFVWLAVAYSLAGFLISQTVLGLACVVVFFFVLFVRMLHDWQDARSAGPS